MAEVYVAPAEGDMVKLVATRRDWQQVIDALSPNRRLADPLTIAIMDVLTHATEGMIPVLLDRENAKKVMALSQRL